MQRYALFPEHANFSGIFFVKKGISGLSLTWVKGMGRAHILYIYAHGRWTSPAAELRGTGRKEGDERGRTGGGGMDGLDKMGRGYSRGLCMVNITVPQMQKVSSGEISIWG